MCQLENVKVFDALHMLFLRTSDHEHETRARFLPRSWNSRNVEMKPVVATRPSVRAPGIATRPDDVRSADAHFLLLARRLIP
jgi:hypothetical protein